MDSNKEYHDPDYPEAAVCIKEEPPQLSEEDKIEKIKSIVRREFTTELEARENEVLLIDQRLTSSRRLLHRLRYSIVSRYYQQQKLQLTNTEINDEVADQRDPKARAESSALLRESQRAIHPSVRKLLGKEAVDMNEILRTRGPRNKTRKDYSAMLKSRNYTISADSTKSLRPSTESSLSSETSAPTPSTLKKQPRRFNPVISNVISLAEATRNQMKQRYRIVIGNTSKYVPSSSRLDKSTHKWLLYIRAMPSPSSPGVGTSPPEVGTAPLLVTSAVVTLHHSYAPHHIVTLDKPPFQVSRRGWGEFPAKIELHFPLPERNRPVIIEHTIKLDRNYTGLQMLGSETVVDVWLYSTPEMLPYTYRENDDTPLNTQTNTNNTETHTNTNNTEIKQEIETDWMDFFKSPSELDVDEMIIKPIKNKEPHQNETSIKNDEQIVDNILNVPKEVKPPTPTKRIVKYIDPSTGKIYYLEMDRELDLTKVQEIIINNTTAKISPIQNGTNQKKKKISLLKPEVKNQCEKRDISKNYPHIQNDHCYLATPRDINDSVAIVKKEKSLYDNLCGIMYRFTETRQVVNYLLKKIPIISCEARDPDFLKNFPFVVENSQKYWKLDFAKRRNIEWSRSKLINRILTEHFHGPTWRTKQILLYSRLHGYHPIRSEIPIKQTDDWSSWNDDTKQPIKEKYPNPSDIDTLTPFKFDFDSSLTDVTELSDEEDVDVVADVRVNLKKEVAPDVVSCQLTVLPVENNDDRLRFMFLEKKCADIGIELKNEDVGNGFSYSAVHAVLLSAMKSFAEEMIRSSLAVKRREDDPRDTPSVWAGGSSVSSVCLRHVFGACGGAGVTGVVGDGAGVRSGGTGVGDRLAFLSLQGLAAKHKNTTPI